WHDGAGLRVRLYAHGGLLGRLWGTVFLGSSRMVEEFRMALHAVREGVPTAEPFALRVERVLGPFVRAMYVTETIPDAVNLLQLCESGRAGELSPAQRAGLADALARTVARMHDAGILHGDLNLKNLLVRNACDAPEAFVIDFDRARRRETVSLAERMANLLRLDRSILKWPASRQAIGVLDRMRLLHSYLARYPQWADRWARIARRYGSGHLRHRLFRQKG
ncbi:MAG: lipopolysaccharide kinase InaA family protein, partial [Candidatus Brocadiaceae bacterium]